MLVEVGGLAFVGFVRCGLLRRDRDSAFGGSQTLVSMDCLLQKGWQFGICRNTRWFKSACIPTINLLNYIQFFCVPLHSSRIKQRRQLYAL